MQFEHFNKRFFVCWREKFHVGVEFILLSFLASCSTSLIHLSLELFINPFNKSVYVRRSVTNHLSSPHESVVVLFYQLGKVIVTLKFSQSSTGYLVKQFTSLTQVPRYFLSFFLIQRCICHITQHGILRPYSN